VTFDALQEEYVVVWTGDDSSLGTADDEYEVFLRRVSDTGALLASSRISTMGSDGVVDTSTSLPDITFSDVSLGTVGAVWNAENELVTGNGDGEIWGQFDTSIADLAVSITVLSDTSPDVGDDVEYRIDWINQGPDIVSEVTLSSSVGALFQGATATPPAIPGPTMTWSLGTLDPGESGSVTVSGTVASAANGALVTFDAGIDTSSLIVDFNPGNDTTNGSVTVDRPPTVTINQAGGQADPTNAAPVDFAVQFSEPVSGFTDSDVALSTSTVGGTLTASVTGSGADYTVSVSGMTGSGDVVASIPAGAADDVDGDPDASSASTSTDNAVSFDSQPPTVQVDQVLAQPDPTNASPIQFVVLFSESVTGFDGSDVSFTGSTVGGTPVAGVTGSGALYVISVTGMGDPPGTVVVSLPAGAANDLAGNASELGSA
jgi:hypothetical protein